MNKQIDQVIVYINDRYTKIIKDASEVREYGGRVDEPLRIIIRKGKNEYVYVIKNIYGYEVIYK